MVQLSTYKKLVYYSTQQKCWKCEQNSSPGQFCNAILPPTEDNLFEYIGLPKRFPLQEIELKTKFRDLQFKLHPDKFVQSSKREKELSEEHSRRLNKVFQTLSEPLARANYLLELKGVEKKGDLNQEQLIEMMERNENISTLKERVEIENEIEKLKQEVDKEISALSDAFENEDYDKAQSHVTFLTYLYSMRNSLNQKLQSFFSA